MDDFGGYGCHFVEEPPDALVCPVCLLPCREPHLISCCGKKACHSCISRVQLAGQPCPLCRTPEFATMIDREIERQVLSLKVYCNNKQDGCTWIGELRQLEGHLNTCLSCFYRDYVVCKYKCGFRCPQQQMFIHERDECELRPEIVLTKTIDDLKKKVVELERKLTNEQKITHAQNKKLAETEYNLKRALEDCELVTTENVELKKEMKKSISHPQSVSGTELQEKIAKLEYELKHLQLKHNERIAEKNLAIENLQESLKAKETALNSLQHEKADKETSIEALNVENEQLRCQLYDLQEHLAHHPPPPHGHPPPHHPPPPHGHPPPHHHGFPRPPPPFRPPHFPPPHHRCFRPHKRPH